jgi:3-hydroxyisobutyrate dehydrogenase-like beta-hydroxyacid dehydrogenase
LHNHVQAPVSGSKKPAIDGQLIILAAGDEGLFGECEAAFSAMVSRQGIFLNGMVFF